METKSETKLGDSSVLNSALKTQEEILISPIKTEIETINLSGDQSEKKDKLSGVFCEGVQYYDLKNTPFINNTGLANLIDLLKSLLKQGKALQFVNVNKKIKEKIKSMGLGNILNCK